MRAIRIRKISILLFLFASLACAAQPNGPPSPTFECPAQQRGDDLKVWTGNLLITNAGDLNFLSTFHRVDGDLMITAPDVQTLVLENLCFVDGDLHIEGNDDLWSFNFPVLGHVDGGLRIYNNPKLEWVYLNELRSISDSLTVLDNDELVYLGLGAVGEIGGDLWISAVGDLTQLNMTYLSTVGGEFRVANADAILELDLRALKHVHDDIVIRNNTSLTAIYFGNMDTLAEQLRVEDNPWLRTIDLKKKAPAKSISIDALPVLQSLDLSDTKSMEGGLFVTDSSQITSIDLSGLEVAKAQIRLRHLDSLEALHLPNLSQADGALQFYKTGLQSLSLPALEHIKDSLYLENSKLIEAIDLPLLRHIEGNLDIDRLDLVTEFTLPNLERVDGLFTVRSMPILQSFSSPTLTEVGNLEMWQNESLEDFNLPELTHAEAIYIRKNEMLSHCIVNELVERLIAQGFEGPVHVELNGTELPQQSCD